MSVGYVDGQVFERVDKPGRYVVVCEVRDESHPKGLGSPYGGSACALPWPYVPEFVIKDDHARSRRVEIALEHAHPFDVVILCRSLPSHGDQVWRYVEGT
jgi:hypothetical protein